MSKYIIDGPQTTPDGREIFIVRHSSGKIVDTPNEFDSWGAAQNRLKELERADIDESLAAMLAWIRAEAGEFQALVPDHGYSGRIKHANDLHAVQNIGRCQYVIHEQSALLSRAVEGQHLDIQYREGLVTKMMERERGKGKGGIAD